MTTVSGAVRPEWIGRAPHQDLRSGERPVLPSKDPFYLPPAGFEHAAAGTVLMLSGHDGTMAHRLLAQR